jgi:hypothetical protein
MAWLAFRFATGRSTVSEPRVYEPWACGYPFPRAADPLPERALVALGRTQFTATAFAQPFLFLFRRLFSWRKRLQLHAKRTRYLPERIVVKTRLRNPFDAWVYRPLRHAVIRVSAQVAHLQTGSIQVYLGYAVIAVILLLLGAP